VPDRKPVKWNGTRSWMLFQYCHFSCQPTPSKLSTMNCGGFWPAFSLVGTNPSGWAPAGAVVGVVAGVAVALLDVDGVVDGADCVVEPAATSDELTAVPGEGIVAGTVTLLVMVTGAPGDPAVQPPRIRPAVVTTANQRALARRDRRTVRR
jgi:hypothetical protein